MNVSLTPELEAIIEQKVRSGMYGSGNGGVAGVREGLRLLQKRDQTHEAKLSALRADIQKGIDSLEAGRYRDVSDAMADIKERLMAKKPENG